MVNQYETTFIITPVLSEDQVKDVIKKFKEILVSLGSEIIFEDHWGLKKLTYPIQKKSTGFYHLIEYKADGPIIQKFETELKHDEKIMRFLTVKLDKHSLAYNIKKRNKNKIEKVEA